MTNLSGADWIATLAARLGVEPPSDSEVEVLLNVASAAAHASERPAAPISTWLCARAGLSPDEALAAVANLAGELGATEE